MFLRAPLLSIHTFLCDLMLYNILLSKICYFCRTDNAVKNRFSTLCKKRAKYEALAKENKNSHINLNNKRIILHDGFNTDGRPENDPPIKKIRYSGVLVSADNSECESNYHS